MCIWKLADRQRPRKHKAVHGVVNKFVQPIGYQSIGPASATYDVYRIRQLTEQ